MTTEKALREALDTLVAVVGLTAFKYEGQRKPLQEAIDNARAALSLPETQGEPVAGDVEWLHKFINCTPFGADAPAEDMQRAHRIVDSLYAAPPSQPAQGWRLVPVEPTQAMMEAAAPFPEHLRAEHPNPDDPWHEGMFIATKCDQLAARTTYRAMLAAVPAAPTQAKPTNGEGA